MKTFSIKITLLLTSMFLLSLPLMAQKGSTPKELAKQEKAIRKLIKECEAVNVVKNIVFTKRACYWSSDQRARSQEKINKWAKNNEIILKNMPDIIYLGSKMIDESQPNYVIYRYEYTLISLQESNTFPNQTSNFSDMNKQGAGYFYSDETYRKAHLGGVYTTEGEKKFYLFDKINWTGNIKNGKIDGDGEGYCRSSNGVIYYVKGSFDEGRPKGNCAFYRLNAKTNELKHANVKVGSFNGGFAQMTKSDEEGKVLYVDKSFGIFDINGSLANIYIDGNFRRTGIWSKYSTLKSFVDNKVVALSSYISRDKFFNIIDSIKMEIFVDAGGGFIGLTENGKQSVLEYYKGIIPMAENLFKVFNTQEVKDPFNNLKTHYNFDVQQLKNKLTTVEHLPEYIPQADSIYKAYKANPNISKKIDIGKDLYSIYELLENDYYKKDFSMNYYAVFGKSSFMKDKAEMATEKLNALMNNPLFPHRNQAVANAIKSQLASVVDSYAKDYAIALKEYHEYLDAAAAQYKKINDLVETYDIPKIVRRDSRYDESLGMVFYSYSFEDGIGGIIYTSKHNSYYYVLDVGPFETLRDAECALYFYKKYGEIRRKGKVGT